MPTTVKQLFNHFNILDFNQVKWDTNFCEQGQGVYIVSTSGDPGKHWGITDNPNFDDKQIELWLSKLQGFQVDGNPATLTNLKNRLAEFWLPDESILYIGKAPVRKNKSGISNRVMEYFKTEIGDGGPHSGGQWIKVLKDLDSYTVYYGTCKEPAEVEKGMMSFFMSNVSEAALSKLYDKRLPLPFANIRFTGNKKHGLKNQRL